jgi:lipopolysaccharide export system permease protein
LVFVGLYFIADIFSNLSDILKAKPPFSIVIAYYLYMLPLIFLRVSPFALLISVLYTIGELNRNNEIITLRSAGLSVFRISLPAIFLALTLSFFALFIQERVLMNSQKKVDDIKVTFIKKDADLASEETNIAFHSKDMIIFAERLLPKSKTLDGVIIFKEDSEGNIVKKTICKNIVYTNGKWQAQNIIDYNLDAYGNIVDTPQHWKEKYIDIEEKPEELVFKKSIFAQFSSLKDLKKEIDRLKKVKGHLQKDKLIIDYHQKLADPLSHFFLVMGVLPIALEIKKRKVALSSLGVGLIFGFIYFYVASLSIAFGKSGFILPILSAWIAPLFFLTVGLTGIKFIR